MMDYGKIMSAEEAISHVKDGDRVMVGGFGQVGCPFVLEAALCNSRVKDLTIIANGADLPGVGLGRLLENGQIKALIGNYYSWNQDAVAAYNRDEIEVTLVPQGTFAEAIRAGGYGIPAFYTPTSAGTMLGEEGTASLPRCPLRPGICTKGKRSPDKSQKGRPPGEPDLFSNCTVFQPAHGRGCGFYHSRGRGNCRTGAA